MLPRLALTFAVAAIACPAADRGQFEQSTSPAYVAVADAGAVIQREGRVETAPINMPLLPGDRLRTADGRMEIRLTDGSLVDLDVRTTVDVQSDELLRLIDGRIRVTVARAPRPVTYRVDAAPGTARLTEPGEYRLAIVPGSREGERQLELSVIRGSGEISTDHGSTTVRAGELAYAAADLQPSLPYAFNSASIDEFDRWPAAPEPAQASLSTQYLPSDLQSYASTFDQYGVWGYEQAYGFVWYPRVSAGWRPYSSGRWMSYPRYGWTWIGADRFAWPTHHYGRWGVSSGAWFWIPASRWAPAYVSWAHASDSVRWCPLGWDNRAVLGSSARWTGVSRADFDRGRSAVRPPETRSTQTSTVLLPPSPTVLLPPSRSARNRERAGTRSQAQAPTPAAARASTPAAVAEPSRPAAHDNRVRDVAVPRATAPSFGPSAVSERSESDRATRPVNRGADGVRSPIARPIAPAAASPNASPANAPPNSPPANLPAPAAPPPPRASTRPADTPAPPPPQRGTPPAEHGSAPKETAHPGRGEWRQAPAPPASTTSSGHRGRGGL